MSKGKTICVVGASGLVGANIVKEALARGYRVNGTLRNAKDTNKTKHLKALPNAENLTLFSANMSKPVQLPAAISGTDAVFIASLIPTYKGPDGTPPREMDDEQGYEEIVRPTLDGCMNILTAADNLNIKNVIICSSTSSTNPVPPVQNKNEIDHWSDVQEQYRAKKYTSAAKAVMEKAAMTFADEHDIRLSILLPTLMLGPALLPNHCTEGFTGVLNQMVKGGASRHSRIPNGSNSMIYTEDIAKLFLAAYESPKAQGRYFGVYDSWHWQDIYAVLAGELPDTPMPTPLEETPDEPTSFDFTRRDSLGVKLRPIPEILKDTIDWLKAQN